MDFRLPGEGEARDDVLMLLWWGAYKRGRQNGLGCNGRRGSGAVGADGGAGEVAEGASAGARGVSNGLVGGAALGNRGRSAASDATTAFFCFALGGRVLSAGKPWQSPYYYHRTCDAIIIIYHRYIQEEELLLQQLNY